MAGRALLLSLVYQAVFFAGTTMGLTIAVPALSEDFDVSLTVAAWVQIAYFLGLIAGSFPIGRMTVLLERRSLITFGLLGDIILMVGIILIPNIYFVIVLRFLSAILRLFPWLVLQIEAIGGFPPEHRGKIVGAHIVVQGVGMLISIPLVGYVTEEFGWRWLFIGTSSVYAALIPAVWLLLPRMPRQEGVSRPKLKDFDLLGSGLVMIGSVAIITGLQLFVRGDVPPTVLLLFFAGVAVLGLFVWVELRSSTPIVPFFLFRIRGVFSGATQASFIGMINGTFILLLPVLFISGYGWSLAHTSGILLFINITRPVSALLAGWLADKYGSARVVTLAAIVAVAGQVLVPGLGSNPATRAVLLAVILIGIGHAFLQTANLRQLYTSMPQSFLHMAPTTNLVIMQMGVVIGQAVVAAATETDTGSSLVGGDPGVVSAASTIALVVSVVFAVAMVVTQVLPWIIFRGDRSASGPGGGSE